MYIKEYNLQIFNIIDLLKWVDYKVADILIDFDLVNIRPKIKKDIKNIIMHFCVEKCLIDRKQNFTTYIVYFCPYSIVYSDYFTGCRSVCEGDITPIIDAAIESFLKLKMCKIFKKDLSFDTFISMCNERDGILHELLNTLFNTPRINLAMTRRLEKTTTKYMLRKIREDWLNDTNKLYTVVD